MLAVVVQAKSSDIIPRVWSTRHIHLEKWSNTGNTIYARALHSSTLLTNEKVAELYDPSTEKWVPTNNMNTQRFGHSAFLLTNGQVLVAGGFSDHFLNTAELYHPFNGTWTIDQKINQTRYQHTTTVLENGKVLVVGGANHQGYLNSTELYAAF